MRSSHVLALSAMLTALACAACSGQDGIFADDFDDGDALGWAPLHGGHDWHVRAGRYVFDGRGWGRYQAVANAHIVDGIISVKATPLQPGELGWGSFGVILKYADPAHYIIVRFGAYNAVGVMQWDHGERSTETIGKLEAEIGREYEARFEVEGDQLRTFLDGQELATTTISMAGRLGRVGLYTETPAAFDDFQVQGVVQPPDAQEEQIVGTPRPQLEFAAFQPDPLMPGEALSVRGRLHLYIRNAGDGAAVLEGITCDGQDGERLLATGRLAWYHQRPYRIEPGEVGRVSLRHGGARRPVARANHSAPSTGTTAAMPGHHRSRWRAAADQYPDLQPGPEDRLRLPAGQLAQGD